MTTTTTTTPTERREPMAFAETTAWTPAHVGRAIAIRDAYIAGGTIDDAVGVDVLACLEGRAQWPTPTTTPTPATEPER